MASNSLVLLLGDQLSLSVSSLKSADRTNAIVLMAEVREEATYVPHHKKKIAYIFSAMRHFAAKLQQEGWAVDYVKLDDEDNSGSLTGEIDRAIKRHDPTRIIVTEPGEWRVLKAMEGWPLRFGVDVTILDDSRFLCSRDEFAAWAEGRKQLRMEYFYREMRRKAGLLMDDDQPEGGKWNYDAENRKPAGEDLELPPVFSVEPDEITQEVLKLVGSRFAGHFGDLEPFWFAVTAEQAEQALDHFIEFSLPAFGDYQDAMLLGERYLFHSVLSHYMHSGLLDPLNVCKRVEAAYNEGRVPLNAAEGYIRQIIGWREYVRGIYWLKMPEYAEANFLQATRPLPEFYWTGETDMTCIREAVLQTKETAYAHHIQRLMVTGNFAMLAGVDPNAVHEWYLAVYADAYEWVEMPNTIGMSQFADGGVLGSKPYAASGNYINKMSNYCQHCHYNVKEKTGETACPFNALYWDFLARNVKRLRTNPRLSQIYRTWDRMAETKQVQYRDSAAAFLGSLA